MSSAGWDRREWASIGGAGSKAYKDMILREKLTHECCCDELVVMNREPRIIHISSLIMAEFAWFKE